MKPFLFQIIAPSVYPLTPIFIVSTLHNQSQTKCHASVAQWCDKVVGKPLLVMFVRPAAKLDQQHCGTISEINLVHGHFTSQILIWRYAVGLDLNDLRGVACVSFRLPKGGSFAAVE